MVVADPGLVLFATALATALVGSLVAATAFRGYRRHESQTMLYVAIGIALITVTPFVVSYGLAVVFSMPDAGALLTILIGNILGLLALLYSLEV